MLVHIIRTTYLVVCAGAIAAHMGSQSGMSPAIERHPLIAFFVLLVITQIPTILDLLLKKKRIEMISAVYFGLLIGFLLSYLLTQAIEPVFSGLHLHQYYRTLIRVMVSMAVTYLSITLLVQTKDDFRFVIPYVEFARELREQMPWILDSSALIDGRVAELPDTNMIHTQMIVPDFVLHEVQDIADSSDKVRRTRGRRGLEVLGKLQGNSTVDIVIRPTEQDEYSGLSVDQKLVEVAKKLNGRIVTNDYNLNKVASIQQIGVINLNDVANCLKPRYLPGEPLRIKILKEGETPGQGVGYLDDGTMVVCENAADLVGQDIDVVVTSVLQSSAGRMIFGRQE